MSDENFRALHGILRSAQDRYTYFLLAAAGSAIAFALTRTESRVFEWTLAPLGIAVLAWALSFWRGCRYIAYVNSTLFSNSELLRVQSGTHPNVGQHPEIIAAASDGIRSAIKENCDTIEKHGKAQTRLLILGFAAYLVWHLVEMTKRSIA